VSDVQRALHIQPPIQPVITADELLCVTLRQQRVTQFLRPSHRFPTKRDAGIRQALGYGLQAQGLPAGFACDGNEFRAVMERIEVRTDHVRIKEGRGVVADQNGNLAERIFGKNSLVALGGAGFLVDDAQAVGKSRLVGEDQDLWSPPQTMKPTRP
jgi:hypothetical protein